MCKASNIKFPSEIIQCFDEALQRHLFWNLVSHLTVADLFKIIKTESFPRWMTLGPGIKTSLVFLKALSMLTNLVLAFIKHRGLFFFFHAVSQETSERKMPRPPMPLVFFIALQYGSESCRVSGKQIFRNYKIWMNSNYTSMLFKERFSFRHVAIWEK